MDLRAIREALRLLRLQNNLSVRGIEGLDKATVHRIENIKRNPAYSPELASVARIVEACGYTLAQFFARLDDTAKTVSDAERPDVLAELADARKLRQVAAFLLLRDEVRQALALSSGGTSEPDHSRPDAPTRGPRRGARTKAAPKRRRQAPDHKVLK